MKRATKIAVTILILILTAELTIATNVKAIQISQSGKQKEIIIVDKNGDGDYTSIREAINQAQSGFTIYVKKGEYKEIIDIKIPITLIGEDKKSTLINPISEKNKYAVSLGAPGVRISRLSIYNGAPGLYTSGIRVTSPSTEISDCKIYETPVGIVIWTSNNIVKNCYFERCNDEGIVLIGSPYYGRIYFLGKEPIITPLSS